MRSHIFVNIAWKIANPHSICCHRCRQRIMEVRMVWEHIEGGASVNLRVEHQERPPGEEDADVRPKE